jgi:NAD(P)-dependent dehydrogenase (short-subunit alcohol dehydrogenase family)
MKDVEGKVAFVTGGASGLGLAMTRSFTRAGMKVVVADVEDSALAAVNEEFAESNAAVLTMKVDVTDRDAMEQAAVQALDAFGKVHVVCNNAGVAVGGNVADMGYSDWDWVMKVNLDGVVNGIVSFVNRIREQGEGGHIVNTASMAGQLGIGGMSVYNTTKFGVVGMSEAMRHDLAEYNIGVSVLCPGIVATNIFTSQRNRPGEFGGPSEEAALGSGDFALGQAAGGDRNTEEMERLQAMMSNILDPAVIGDMVLHAVQNDVFYILSHPEFKEAIGNRGNELAETADYWAAYRSEHGV